MPGAEFAALEPVRLASAVIGLVVIVTTFYWAARILMVKGTDPPIVARFLFRITRNALHFAGDLMPNAAKRRELWALYIPVSLVGILGCSLVLATLGYMLLLYGVTENSLRTAYSNSISSMSTLGIAGEPKTLLETTIGGIEAFTGPVFVALLVAYTVTIYSAYSDRRERIAAMDERLGNLVTGSELLVSAARRNGLDWLDAIWSDWIDEFKQLERTYRSVDGYLLLFAPDMGHHWAADAPMVLDAAALRNTLVAGPPDDRAQQCVNQASIAVTQLAEHYQHRVFSFRAFPRRPEIDRSAFDNCAQELAEAGISTTTDLDQAWLDFQATRGRYAPQVTRLARMLPYDGER